MSPQAGVSGPLATDRVGCADAQADIVAAEGWLDDTAIGAATGDQLEKEAATSVDGLIRDQ